MAKHTLTSDKNIIISGFMGTGKSTVGRVLAERLGWPFVDTDQLIEQRLGMSVGEMFSKYGENFFREKECLLASELAKTTGRVIATGGGTLVSAANLEALSATGLVFNLTCDPEEIVRRLQHLTDRPLLQGSDRLARIEELLVARQAAYASIPFHVDTTPLSVDEVAEHILEICREQQRASGLLIPRPSTQQPEVFRVSFPLGSYDVWFGESALSQAGGILRQNGLSGVVAVVTSQNVFRLHGRTLLRSLESAGFVTHKIKIPDGEQHKTLRTVQRLYDRFVDLKLDRTSTIVALGGGVGGDIVGFAAATYMRGLPLVQVPTTLLAQTDSSIGGKVGVDLARGKNLVGAFYPPRLVITDPLTLRTLPDEEFRTGLAEVVKAGVIRSRGLFEALERYSSPRRHGDTEGAGECSPPLGGQEEAALTLALSQRERETSSPLRASVSPWCNGAGGWDKLISIIREAVQIKVDVVREDPFERGVRAILNYGHTVGHAIETVSQYRVRHGEAVSVGMIAAAKIAVKAGLCAPEVEARMANLLRRLELPTEYVCSPDAVFSAMSTDKKKRHGQLRFVLPKDIGEVIVTSEVPEGAVREALDEVCLRS